MPAPVLAAPLVIPFAEAIGVSIAALGMAKATDKVNEFIQENPEQSIKIFQMIMPSQGIANALKNKSSEGDEEVSEDIDVEVEEKPKLTGKEKSEKIKAAIRRARAGKGNYSSPDAEGSAVDIRGSVIREAEDMGLADKDLKDKPYKEKGYDFRDYIPRGAYKKRYADGGSIGIEVLFEEKKPRKDFNTGGRATTQDFANALQRVSAGTTYQQQAQAKDYARQEASNLLSEAMRSGNQGNIQSILQGIGGSPSMGGMQFNTSGNRIISIPATGPGRDKILNAMANQMLSTTTYAPPPPPTDSLTGMLESQMLPNMADGSMRSLAEQNAIRDKVLAAQKAQEQSYFMTDPVTGKKYSTEAEAIDDLGLVTYNQRFADGGRVGLFMGGPALEGPALGIYNSMKAYNSFTDQEIANAIKEAGYELPTSSTPDPTPDPGQGAGQSGGRGSDQNAGYVDRQDYSFNKKNYRPGNQLEINPAAFGVSFPDQPSSPKREGIINQAIDSFTSLPTRSLSSFASPTTGGNIVGPAEQGFMGQTLDIDPAARTREEIRSLYDNYNRFKGRTSNFADARQKGKVGEVLGNILGFASGIPFLGPLAMLSNAFGPQGDKSLQSKYTVDNAGFGNTGAIDEFGLATFDKKDGFLGLTGNTTRDYTNRMNERLGELDDFFGERIDNFDINNINAATFNKMSKINGFYAKQVQAYKNRLEAEKINKEQKEKERMEASAANRAEANAITNRLANEYKAQQQRDGRDFSVSGPDTSANPTGKSNQASSERGYALHGAKGGSVPTGLATMFKEKR
jgi:ribosomal protein L9